MSVESAYLIGELPPSEWSIDYDSLDHERDEECRSKKHKPEEIIGKLREVEIMLGQGGTTAEACRRIAVTECQLGGHTIQPGERVVADREVHDARAA